MAVYKDTPQNRKLGRVGQSYQRSTAHLQAYKFAPGQAGPGRRSPLTQTQAMDAFKKFYSPKGRYRKIQASLGKPSYVSSAKRAMAQDKLRSMSAKKIVADARYKSRPDLYDYLGVDTGKLSWKGSPAQRAALARGKPFTTASSALARARRSSKAKRRSAKPSPGQRPMSAAQKAALARGRAMRATNLKAQGKGSPKRKSPKKTGRKLSPAARAKAVQNLKKARAQKAIGKDFPRFVDEEGFGYY